jgi:hypothetical protein
MKTTLMRRKTDLLKRKQFRKDRKGISTLIISVYVCLLILVLISTIFLNIESTKFGILASTRTEEDRSTEGITINGPDGLQLVGSGKSIIGAIRVNNTGSIAVRIRALYIDQKFIADPSTYQDTYIAPQSYKWISLLSSTFPYLTMNDTTLKSYWTVATERGTSATEKGQLLLFGSPGEENEQTHQFSIGPLLIDFDLFNWRTGNNNWESGWAVPKSNNPVTWRILIINLDPNPITLSNTCFFQLVANTNNQGQNQAWFIDPTTNQQKTLASGEGTYVQFTTNAQENPQQVSLNPGVSCLNYLVMVGKFSNGSSYGQTIPFEAVLITNTPSMTLSANPTTITTGSSSTSTITATVTDSTGTAIPNALVTFTTNLGTLSSPIAATNSNGIATITFTAGSTPGQANVQAICLGITKTVTINITG